MPLLPVAMIVGGLAGIGLLFLLPGETEILLPVQSETGSVAPFKMCGRAPHNNCVIDGDTFYFQTQSIRIADIDTPETNPPRCDAEAALGGQATRRLLGLLNGGPFELRELADRDEDQFGRKLRTVVRDGRSLGGVLVSEGLARRWTGRRLPWCD